MNKKYKIINYDNKYEIMKVNIEGNLSVKELKEILEFLIEEKKGEYIIYTEGFCCGTSGVEISDRNKEICIS